MNEIPWVQDKRSRTYGIELAIGERLREDAGVQEAEQIPLGAGLGLKIPEDPAPRVRLVGLQLRFNVTSRIIFELLTPRLDEVDVGAWTDEFAAGIGAVVARADSVPVQRGGAVGLGGRPFADDDPVVGIGGVAANIVANCLAMLLRGR